MVRNDKVIGGLAYVALILVLLYTSFNFLEAQGIVQARDPYELAKVSTLGQSERQNELGQVVPVFDAEVERYGRKLTGQITSWNGVEKYNGKTRYFIYLDLDIIDGNIRVSTEEMKIYVSKKEGERVTRYIREIFSDYAKKKVDTAD